MQDKGSGGVGGRWGGVTYLVFFIVIFTVYYAPFSRQSTFTTPNNPQPLWGSLAFLRYPKIT